MKQADLFDNTEIHGRGRYVQRGEVRAFSLSYMYLEGYSSTFVEGIRAEGHADGANDSSSHSQGQGQRPLRSVTRGVRCGDSEVNPVMRWVISSKLAVAGLS